MICLVSPLLLKDESALCFFFLNLILHFTTEVQKTHSVLLIWVVFVCDPLTVHVNCSL